MQHYKIVKDCTVPDEINLVHIPVGEGDDDMEERRYHSKNIHYFINTEDFIIEAHKRWAGEGKHSFGQMDTSVETTEDAIKLHNHCQALANFSDLI